MIAEIKNRKQAKLDGNKLYFTNKICSNGHVSVRYVSTGNCKECNNMRIRDNPGKHKQHVNKWLSKNPNYYPKRRAANYALNLWSHAKYRAKERNLEFNITVSDVVIPKMCPVFGKPFVIPVSSRTSIKDSSFSPTIDRIDNSKGYTKDNSHVISRRANTLKRDATIEELKLIIKYMEQQ